MLKLHFLNVDNGDCIILEHESDDSSKSFALVDSNTTPDRKNAALDKLKELGARELSFVCITHPDKDHYSGILSVLEYFGGKIDQFITYPFGRVLSDPKLLKKYLQQIAAIAARGDDPEFARRHAELMQIIRNARLEFLPRKAWHELTGDYDRIGVEGFSDVEFYGIMPPKRITGSIVETVLGTEPRKTATLNRNDISAAIVIRYAGRTIVLGGDATNQNWQSHRKYRKRARISITSDVVKLPHHGSRRDNSKETLRDFFEGKDACFAIISADGRSHPDFEIFPMLDEFSCTRLCTNVCNPNERATKRIHRDDELARELVHNLNVYTELITEKPSPCKGDITVNITKGGVINYKTQYNTICDCSSKADILAIKTLKS